MKITISVIIPTFKPGGYIQECLESLARQTLKKGCFELIIILNGCNEPYLSNLSEWKNKHPDMNFNIIQTETPGVSNARNLGMKAASGEYIVFIDDDDYVSPTFLEKLINKTKNNNDCIVLSNSFSFIDGTHNFDESYYISKIYHKLRSKKSIDLIHSRSFFNGNHA